MAYKGKKMKKVPIYKQPAFWLAIAALVIILVLVIWVATALSSEEFTVRKPEATEPPVSQTAPPRDSGSDPAAASGKSLWHSGF